MSLVTRNVSSGVCDQLRHKLACAATEVSWRLEILDIETRDIIRAPSSEFVSSSSPSWQILTAHAQPFRRARDLAFCLKVPLNSLLVWASSEGSGETARMRRLAWTIAARIGYKYQIRLTRSILSRQWITKTLIRLCRICAVWFVSLLFAYDKKQVFSYKPHHERTCLWRFVTR